MKATVLVIGQNVERQIIDLEQRNILYDENNRAWLDIRFDNRALAARSSKRIFSQLGLLKRTLGLLDYQVMLPEKARNQIKWRFQCKSLWSIKIRIWKSI